MRLHACDRKRGARVLTVPTRLLHDSEDVDASKHVIYKGYLHPTSLLVSRLGEDPALLELAVAVDQRAEFALDKQGIAHRDPDYLGLGGVQPPDEGVGVAERSSPLARAREAARENSGKGVLRRLNRAEYRNTVRDLFDLRMIDFDPTTTFPPDDSLGGFDNVGEGLVTSGHLLQNYLEAARKVADKAIRPGPKPQMIRYEMASKAAASSLNKDNRKAAGRMFIKFRQPLGSTRLDKKRGVPSAGEYVIRLSARAIRRNSSAARRGNCRVSTPRRSEERRVGTACRARWSPYH